MPRQKKGQCRFCLENDSIKNLLSPCDCKGSAKYVHNDCLVKWTEAKPETGHICNSCGIECERIIDEDIETITLMFKNNVLFIKNPYTMIYTTHWVCYWLYTLLYPGYSYYILYSVYQFLFHSVYLLYFSYILSRVKNIERYALYWLLTPRITIFITHIYFIYTFPHAVYIGGFGSNICIFAYFYEHYRVVCMLNKDKKPIFLSKDTRM
jgi:hypothetical protein